MALWHGNRVEKLAFDSKFLKEQVYDIPIIGVGNITVGSTGKTPHVEYIVSNLASDYNLAVLSGDTSARQRALCSPTQKARPT